MFKLSSEITGSLFILFLKNEKSQNLTITFPPFSNERAEPYKLSAVFKIMPRG